tara:strand:- start:1648 stop:2355 length:708 start_codon:yes stop_codon:yes gene_type:complete
MAYDRHNSTIQRMSIDFSSWVYPSESVHCPSGVTMERAYQSDRHHLNGDVASDYVGNGEFREKWLESKMFWSTTNKRDVPFTHGEAVRHDVTRLSLMEEIRKSVDDHEHDSKRLTYFASNYVRYQFWCMACLAAMENEVVTIGYVAETLSIPRTTLRKVIKECLDAGWITAHEVDANMGYMATDETVNTYYLRLRRNYQNMTTTAMSLKSSFESLIKYEDKFNARFNPKKVAEGM